MEAVLNLGVYRSEFTGNTLTIITAIIGAPVGALVIGGLAGVLVGDVHRIGTIMTITAVAILALITVTLAMGDRRAEQATVVRTEGGGRLEGMVVGVAVVKAEAEDIVEVRPKQ